MKLYLKKLTLIILFTILLYLQQQKYNGKFIYNIFKFLKYYMLTFFNLRFLKNEIFEFEVNIIQGQYTY